MKNKPENIERIVSSFCDDVLDILRAAVPSNLLAAAKEWQSSQASDEAMQHARRQFADDVDRFIRRLPNEAISGHNTSSSTKESIHVVALAIDRIESVRLFMQEVSPKRADGTLAELLEAWAIVEWRAWFSKAWKADHGQKPWSAAVEP